MTISRRIRVSTQAILLFTTLSVIFAQPAFAKTCYEFTDKPPALGSYLQCVIPQLFSVFQIIIVTITIIMGMALVAKASLNRENSDFLSQLPSRAMYLIILILLAIGFGGTLINILLQFFGFGEFQGWLDFINQFLDKLNYYVS